MRTFRFLALAALFSIAACNSSKEVIPPSARQVQQNEVKAFHKPVEMKIAWMPYKNLAMKQTKKNNWVIVESDSTREGAIPVILMTYPETGDSVWVQMDTKNDLLGKLVKHTLMTQEPISKPYTEYFEKASCTKCHPSDVIVNFD